MHVHLVVVVARGRNAFHHCGTSSLLMRLDELQRARLHVILVTVPRRPESRNEAHEGAPETIGDGELPGRELPCCGATVGAGNTRGIPCEALVVHRLPILAVR